MSRSPLADAFGHHVWATLRLLDACLPLTPEQQATSVPGTYGSILDTMRHLVGADASYLHVLTGGQVAEIEEDGMSLTELRAAMEANGPAWSTLVAQDLARTPSSSGTGTTGPTATHRSASASHRRCITGPTIGARSARRSPHWASSRRRSMPGTTPTRTAG
jgi:hypothetical protein